MTFRDWFACKILRRHSGSYLTHVAGKKSRARSGNALVCFRCGGVV